MATKKLSKKPSSSKAKLSTELPRKIKPKASPVKGTPERTSSAKPSKVTKVTPAKVTKKAAKGKDDTAASTGPDVGDKAPSFVLHDHTGTMVSSESLRGSNYVLYFYPKDDTPGCTLEACGFRDETPRFTAKGVKVLGVSPDSPEAHTRFRKKYDLSFPLLSDPEKTLAKAYGVWVKKQNYGREYMGVERSTFFVDRHGVIKKVWRKVRVPGHVDEVLHSV
jgi:peroxiredoxin Q/BCP